MKIIIKPKKITSKNFKKFGEVISTKKGNTIMSIFSARKRKFPMNIKMMEKHPLGSQAFIPMKETKFLVFVAPKGKKPNVKKIESFIIPKQTGINYKPGIWHFPLISIKNMNFLVIDRKGIGNNLAIHNFENEKISLKFK